MAADAPMIGAMNKISMLIETLNAQNFSKHINELKAWNKILRKHIGQQKRQAGNFKNDSYEYDPNTNKVNRFRVDKQGKRTLVTKP